MTFEEQLEILDQVDFSSELELVSELFHRINRIIPEDQNLLTLEPNELVRNAIARMRRSGYSQIPVVCENQVLGVFSYRSFSLGVANLTLDSIQRQKCAPGDLTVDEFVEPFKFARVTAEMQEVFSAMEIDNGILIGSSEKLQGILTPMDFLHYLYKVASPFVLISEIELALRALVRLAVNSSELEACARRALKHVYEENRIPTKLENMTFDNYCSIIGYAETWSKFEPFLGNNRIRTFAKMKEIGELRNVIFHFKRSISVDELDILGGHRDWFLLKAKLADSRKGKRVSDE